MTLGFWDEEDVVDPGPIGLPDPAAELAAGRAALVAGALDEAALHLGLALRLAPALAPAVLEATAGARGPAVAIVRGDAYRVAGHEDEARNAYADAARGGPPERRKRARTKPSKPAAAVASDADDAEAADAAEVAEVADPVDTAGAPADDAGAGHETASVAIDAAPAPDPDGGPIA
jgi:hypothetical protein